MADDEEVPPTEEAGGGLPRRGGRQAAPMDVETALKEVLKSARPRRARATTSTRARRCSMRQQLCILASATTRYTKLVEALCAGLAST